MQGQNIPEFNDNVSTDRIYTRHPEKKEVAKLYNNEYSSSSQVSMKAGERPGWSHQ